MKNTILFLSFFIAISGLGQKIHFGPEIGTNLVQIEKTDLGKDFQPAWYSGIAFEYDFLDWLAIKSGVYYAQKRQSYSSTDTSLSDIISFMGDLGIEGVDLNTYTDIEGRTAQHYIEIPIMASVKVDGLSAYVGGYFGFMFAARNRETITEQTPFMSTFDISAIDPTGYISALLPPAFKESFNETSSQTNLRVFDYGLKGGIGYQFNNIGFNASYQFGLSDYRLNKGTSDTQRHQYFQFSINYMFNLGKRKIGHSSL